MRHKTEDEEEFDEEAEPEEEEKPVKAKANPSREEKIVDAKWTPFHVPERTGIRNTRGDELDITMALAEILNYLDRIEYYIGK